MINDHTIHVTISSPSQSAEVIFNNPIKGSYSLVELEETVWMEYLTRASLI